MKRFFPLMVAVCLSACGSKSNTDTKAADAKTSDLPAPAGNSSASSSGGGSISCTLNGAPWKNTNAAATQTGNSFLNIASDENQKEAISLIENHPATGSLSFNKGISGSYTDPSGKSFGSKDGSGTVNITNYVAPADNKTDGMVEGTFSGTFSFDNATSVVITDGKFSMPVKKL